MKIAKDIVQAIKSKSIDEQTALKLFQLCEEIYDQKLNVGHDQLVRLMLIISNFDEDKFLEIMESNFYGDPRDVLMSAHSQDKTSNYGINKFE